MKESEIITFAEWVSSEGYKYVPVYKCWFFLNNWNKTKTSKELLEIYKTRKK